MMHLQTLVFRNNLIDIIEESEFRGLRSLQILDLSQNYIKKLPSNLFEEQNKLRIFLASHNTIESLPRTLFSTTVLEQLDLSYNSITEFPTESLLEIKETLQSLELTGNKIKSFNFSHIESLQHLRHLSIAKNRIFLPGEARKFKLPKLISLDISHNIIEEVPQWIINSLPNSLESLNFANTSLISVPVLEPNNILFLNLSLNNIQTIQSEAFEHLKKLQVLDFSNNLLQNIHNNVWSHLHNLRSLYLQSNPIQAIQENSFRNMERLQELIIKNLKVQDIQKAAFQRLTALRRIEMDLYSKLKNIDVSQLLQKNNGLREIHLHIEDKKFQGLDGSIPKSVKSVVLEGGNLKHIDESALTNLQTPNLKLDIRNTNLLTLSRNMFYTMNEVKNFTASFKNNKLQTVERIPTTFEKGAQSQLQQLELSGNQLHCDCQLAWIWEWIREYDYQHSCSDINCAQFSIDDLREAKCVNMNKSFIDAFKTDLDCFSNGAQGFIPYNYLTFTVVILSIYVKRFI
ncbi:chaoptin-like [Uloborus diversus]|uniref:chaoptin-like n=1 Tax=Uloborus diversus TaxID=327109 RepID=UPI00240921F4|nr:chaoptin-like [Uloborus diversus]